MRQETASRAILAGILILLVVAGYLATQVAHIGDDVRSVVLSRELSMQTITQIATNQSGKSASISTTRGDSESVADWLARHAAAVAAFEASGG